MEKTRVQKGDIYWYINLAFAVCLHKEEAEVVRRKLKAVL